MDNTIAGSMKDKINMNNTIARSMNDKIDMNKTVERSMNESFAYIWFVFGDPIITRGKFWISLTTFCACLKPPHFVPVSIHHIVCLSQKCGGLRQAQNVVAWDRHKMWWLETGTTCGGLSFVFGDPIITRGFWISLITFCACLKPPHVVPVSSHLILCLSQATPFGACLKPTGTTCGGLRQAQNVINEIQNPLVIIGSPNTKHI
jgi:hypothetical protein